jgi:predicted DNA-binding protein
MTEQEKNNTKTFSVRLDLWLYEKLIAASGAKGKNEYIRNLLILNLNEQQKNNERTTDEQQGITGIFQAKIDSLEDLIKAKDQTIRILEEEKGFLIQDHTRISGQLDRLLMPAPQEIEKKGWWKFWK